MPVTFRDLRYIRIAMPELEPAARYAADILGLQPAGHEPGRAWFQSDFRSYSLCLEEGSSAPDAVALTVSLADELDIVAADLEKAGFPARRLSQDECASRRIKSGITTTAPNGITVEIVWRPLDTGWRYHGPRDAGITGLLAVALACKNVAADEVFWTGALGLTVSDWVGDAAFLRLDGAHHRIALYPSKRDGLLGISYAAEDLNAVMKNFYFLQDRQLPIMHGPGRSPASEATFVTTRGPRDILFTYATGMAEGAAVTNRPPRQFRDEALSHCLWGSASSVPEFQGGAG